MRLVLLALALAACGSTNPNQANYDRVRAEVREELGLDHHDHHKVAEVKQDQAAATAVAGTKDPDAGVEQGTEATKIAQGKKVYGQYCVACHGADGKGMGGLAASFVDDKTRLQKDDAALVKSIREGVSGDVGVMPPWGAMVNEQDALAVIAYMRSEWGGEE